MEQSNEDVGGNLQSHVYIRYQYASKLLSLTVVDTFEWTMAPPSTFTPSNDICTCLNLVGYFLVLSFGGKINSSSMCADTCIYDTGWAY